MRIFLENILCNGSHDEQKMNSVVSKCMYAPHVSNTSEAENSDDSKLIQQAQLLEDFCIHHLCFL